MTRMFNAPRRLIFEAATKPEYVRQWWGPRNATLTVCEIDFRVGGEWRFVMQGPDGSDHPFRGEYREIDPPGRVVQTFIYDIDFIRDFPAVETVTLEEFDGNTLYTNTIRHLTNEARDGHINSGMEPGAAESTDRLEELLATLN